MSNISLQKFKLIAKITCVSFTWVRDGIRKKAKNHLESSISFVPYFLALYAVFNSKLPEGRSKIQTHPSRCLTKRSVSWWWQWNYNSTQTQRNILKYCQNALSFLNSNTNYASNSAQLLYPHMASSDNRPNSKKTISWIVLPLHFF